LLILTAIFLDWGLSAGIDSGAGVACGWHTTSHHTDVGFQCLLVECPNWVWPMVLNLLTKKTLWKICNWQPVPARWELHLSETALIFIIKATVWCLGVTGICLCLHTCHITVTVIRRVSYVVCEGQWCSVAVVILCGFWDCKNRPAPFPGQMS